MDSFWVRTVWNREDLVGQILWFSFLPFSFLYSLGVRARNFLYRLGWLPSRGLPRAVVSVGNLTVGGTGKTPTTLWLAQQLAQRGYKVAILSRGYKRTGKEPTILDLEVNAAFPVGEEDGAVAGDEPVMMAGIYGQTVGVGANRHEVGNQLLANRDVDVFVLDDGFQHRQLGRDLDLLLLGSQWQGWMLPAGPFREPRNSFRRADLYLITGAREQWRPMLRDRPKETVFFGSLRAKGLFGLNGNQWMEYPLSLLTGNKIVAVSAISDPAPFYQIIGDWEGEIVNTLEFADHHNYSAQDWQAINRAGRGAEMILTTEKDILKLVRFPFPREKLLALRVEMAIENGSALVDAVETVVRKKKAGNPALQGRE